jgi:hypothetical protein
LLSALSTVDAAFCATGDEPAIPKGAENSASVDANVLKGKAEMSTSRGNPELRAWQASQTYKQAIAALDGKNFKVAANLFKSAAGGFDQAGYEKYQAQALFAEAQSRRMSGQSKEASKCYQAAIDMFNEYDPLSPYLKPALDYLKKVSPNLKGKVDTQKARLDAILIPTRIMTVDRNVVLKGSLTDFGDQKLLAQKATADVPKGYVDETIHKAFIRMTCLETAELGSNYITAENRWYPLIASGKTVILSASNDFLAPSISVKINHRPYNVAVDLPGIGVNKRTVFLLTDGNHLIAIDPSTEDMWSLMSDFSKKQPKFAWKKLIHFKKKPPQTASH